MFDGEHLLCIYISMVYKLKELKESGEQITYLQNIGKMLENYKSTWVFDHLFNHSCTTYYSVRIKFNEFFSITQIEYWIKIGDNLGFADYMRI